ncbi:MAG: DNA repair protein RecN [Bacteroidetes bacterium]|nr:DNA repair protein RecN [Bacteroidota bacterium]
MLKSLRIQNYALIDEIEIDFEKGFNVITGETGAGKSILLGALELILGKRVDTSVLFDPAKKCIVEGIFLLNNQKQKSFFESHELDFDKETSIRREISSNGKSRAFINDTPVTIHSLNDFSGLLLDIHSQYQSLLLNDSEFQFSILDTFAENKSLLSDYQNTYTSLIDLKKKLSQLETNEINAKKDLDYYAFQQQEIVSLNLDAGSDNKLEDELLILSNAEKIKDTLNQLIFSFDESENSLLQQLSAARKQIAEVSNYNLQLESFFQKIESLEIELKDIQNEMSSFSDKVEIDNERLDQLTARLNAINHLLSKHHLNSVDDLISLEIELQDKIQHITSLGDEINLKQKQIDSTSESLLQLATKLSKDRKKIIPELELKLTDLLAMVGMKKATLKFDLNQAEPIELKEYGIDSLSILFSSNKGVPIQAVSKVASGGELSRLMLCIKHILAGSSLLPSIIFDEIDLGISGEIAFKVGELLSSMSARHQIIAITHLPQVASFGSSHFLVYKTSDQKTTHTKLRKLMYEERILELAQMIGGDNPSKMAIESAKELVRNFS